jgi:hypothetical protein
MWGGVEFSSSLFEGMKVLKAAGLASVEKVRALRDGMLFTRVKGEKPLNTDLKGLGVQGSGTFRLEDIRCLSSCPARWGPVRCGFIGAWRPGPPLGSREVPGSVWCRLVPFR